MNAALEGALMLASFGIEVAPAFGITTTGQCACRNPACHRPGKHAMLYEEIFTGSVNEDAIRAWWDRHPKANSMAHTGRRSRLFVIDIDGAAGFASLGSLQDRHGALPPTFTVRSGSGGLHLYYRVGPIAPDLPSAMNVFGPGLDARGERGRVIGPGSHHASGGRYEIVDGIPPTDTPAWLIATALEPRQLP